ncbi:MAG: cyclic nucleotide-binding domain-containing protein [Chloroflexota bacterium]
MNPPEMVQRLKRIDRLALLEDEALQDLARVVVHERHPQGTVICQQGAEESKFYAIEMGRVAVQAKVGDRDTEVGYLSNGDVFGERALMGHRPRSASVIAETTVDLLSLDRQDFQNLTQKHPTIKRLLLGPEALPLLEQVPLFSQLSEEELAKLASYVGIIFYPPARRVVEQGDIGTTMFIVSEGELVAYHMDEKGQSRPVKAIKRGDAFGETSLLVGEPRDATVVTKTYVELCYINKASFDQFLEKTPSALKKLQVRPEVERKRVASPFPGQQPGEIVEIMDLKHWVALVRALAPSALLLGLLGGALLAVDAYWLGPQNVTSGLEWLPLSFTAVWLLTLIGVFAWHWIDWRNDYHIITTQRVIHIENELFRATSRQELPIHQVQNVGIVQNLWGELLGYGHVRITTAGAAGGLVELVYVTDPEEFQHVIFEQIARAKFRVMAAERAELRQTLRQAIGLGVLDDVIQEQAAPAKPHRPAWLTLLSENWLARRLRQTMTGSGIATFLRHPHLPRMEICEKNQVIWRKHWGVLLKRTWRPMLLCAVFAGLLGGFVSWRMGWFLTDSYQAAVADTTLLILGLLTIPALGWLAWEVEDWRNDLYIASDTHIIDITRTPLLLRESRRQASLDNIQNTSASTKGFWASILKLGDVTIETAGQGIFEFKQVRNPNKVQAEIDKRREAYAARLRREEAERNRATMAKWFEAYHDVSRDIASIIQRQTEQMRPTGWAQEPKTDTDTRADV